MSIANIMTARGEGRARANPFAQLARWIIQNKIAALPGAGLVIIDDQASEEQVPDQAVSVEVHDMRFYTDLMLAGSNGAASAYRDGYWSSKDLTGLFRLMIRNLSTLDELESGLAGIGNWWLRRRHKARSNTRRHSRKNIQAHYDLGNELFALFLDKTLTYSSGYFLEEKSSMEEASIEKLDRICRKLALRPQHRVVEIGTGWGSFAIHAARNYGCQVTTTTISKQQFKLARRRIQENGLEEKIDIQLCDYRDLGGKFDRLVSIEMIEAVGHRFLPAFFRSCAGLLRQDGQACIQAITMPDQRYARYLRQSDFIQQFIFPGSCVPSLTAMQDAITRASDLRINAVEEFGLHYARTLREWRTSFSAQLDAVRGLGYGDDFIRLWEYYLCYCEAGFLERYTGVVQMVLNKPDFGIVGTSRS